MVDNDNDQVKANLKPRKRQRAVELLYQLEITGKTLDSICSLAEPSVKAKQKELVKNVWEKREALDQLIQAASFEWRLERMGYVERSILRLALYEINYDATPIPLAIDAAVELAKLFSGEEAGKFVNGVLGRVVREINE